MKRNATKDDMLHCGGIFFSEVRAAADSVQVGDKLCWKVLTGEPDKTGRFPRRLKTLTVTHKSRHLLTAVDSVGLVHSITYVELAQERRKGAEMKRVRGVRGKVDQINRN